MSDERASMATQRRLGGRYVLGAVLGRGGMAVVHRALDEVLDREVAVKVLHQHLAGDPAFLDRFRREARAAGALSHPNLVAVHDWGEEDDGAFLVLQLVEGPSLRDVLRHRAPLDPDEALAVLGPAATGLGAAHRAGLVHRDVKPENVLIAHDGTVRVTDFGLARAAASATATFGPEVLVGSPHYLSPEAVRGQPLDPRADVYALGILLYECLTGRPPHEGDSPFATAVAHTSAPVPPPSQVRKELDAAMDEVVLTATAHDPDDRHADAQAFADALAEAVGTAPVGLGALLRGVAQPSVAAADETLFGHMASDGSEVTPGQTVVVPVADTDTAVVGAEPDDADGDHPGDTTTLEPELPDDAEPAQPPVPRRGRLRGLVWFVVALLLIGASAAGGYVLWDQVLAPVVPIPSVTGADEDAAVEQLRAAGLEAVVSEERRFDLTVPEDHVLDQDPTGEARTGTPIQLVLSAGPRPVTVPELAGTDEDEALSRLEEAGLVPAATHRHDEEVAAGAVLSTAPAAGEVVDEGSDVEVVVSLGPEPLPVPSLAGEALGQARAALEELGLTATVSERRHDPDVPADHVIEQSPAAGAVLHRGDEVAVVVSEGPAPVTLPNVRDERTEDAVAQLEALGLEVEVELRGGFSAFFNPGRVYDQDPGPDSTRLPGETVVLYAYEP